MPDEQQPVPMAAPTAAAIALCPSGHIAERGDAFVWEVRHFREPVRAFVLRIDGQVHAYVNRCAHVPTEMDWLPGQFLDSSREFILCSIHGAAYEPQTGRCIGGPCGRSRLTVLSVDEADGQVRWYPSRDTQPAAPS